MLLPKFAGSDSLERRTLLDNEIQLITDQAHKFIEIIAGEEMSCRMLNNRFNEVTRDVPVEN